MRILIIIIVSFLTILPLLLMTEGISRTEKEPQRKSRRNSTAGKDNKIVGGGNNLTNEYPYVANYGLVCGAAILSQKWVITSAQCGDQHQNVYVGSSYLSKSRNVTIAQHIMHPKFPNPENQFEYDYQLLKLQKPLQFSGLVKPIKLGSEDDMTPGSYATVSGWGSEYVNGPGTDLLRVIEVPLLDNDDCKNKANGSLCPYVTDNMICAGHEKGGEDACEGDSGGPLVNNGVLIGIVSFGKGCAEADHPGVYSRMSPEVVKWIYQETGLDHKFC